jgi:hypothetical protein
LACGLEDLNMVYAPEGRPRCFGGWLGCCLGSLDGWRNNVSATSPAALHA